MARHGRGASFPALLERLLLAWGALVVVGCQPSTPSPVIISDPGFTVEVVNQTPDWVEVRGPWASGALAPGESRLETRLGRPSPTEPVRYEAVRLVEETGGQRRAAERLFCREVSVRDLGLGETPFQGRLAIHAGQLDCPDASPLDQTPSVSP